MATAQCHWMYTPLLLLRTPLSADLACHFPFPIASVFPFADYRAQVRTVVSLSRRALRGPGSGKHIALGRGHGLRGVDLDDIGFPRDDLDLDRRGGRRVHRVAVELVALEEEGDVDQQRGGGRAERREDEGIEGSVRVEASIHHQRLVVTQLTVDADAEDEQRGEGSDEAAGEGGEVVDARPQPEQDGHDAGGADEVRQHKEREHRDVLRGHDDRGHVDDDGDREVDQHGDKRRARHAALSEQPLCDGVHEGGDARLQRVARGCDHRDNQDDGEDLPARSELLDEEEGREEGEVVRVHQAADA
eukprot:scaffold86682_cov63-Phaeocystis_antarctica.AAC.2